jgi:putative hydrolase of the HAD superfamily
VTLHNGYQVILFDVGNTLLVRDPPDHEVLAGRCQAIGLSLGHAVARQACKRSEVWVGEQTLRESRGAPRMPDDEFDRHLVFTALRTAFPGKTENELRRLTARLQTVPRRKQGWRLADTVHSTLSALKARGFALGIVSNFDETLPELCDRFGLTRYFDAIVVSSIVGVEKPDPEILHIACREFGVRPSASLYVGDHPFDVLCAKKAGTSVAWLCEPGDELPKTVPHEPDYRIHSLADLVHLRLIRAVSGE